jgi:hypothetical protein
MARGRRPTSFQTQGIAILDFGFAVVIGDGLVAKDEEFLFLLSSRDMEFFAIGRRDELPVFLFFQLYEYYGADSSFVVVRLQYSRRL